MQTKRDTLVDILKGIGIVSVVLGHGGTLLPGWEQISTTAFVYLYHLMVFFFAAGMVYNPEKYRDPYVYIGRQIKGSLPLYVCYGIVFLLLHNALGAMGLLDVQPYALSETVIWGVSILTFQHTELLLGPLWFVPMFLLAKSFFAVGFQKAHQSRCRLLLHLIVIVAAAAVGLYTNYYGMYLPFHVQTAFLGIPVIYLGYLFNRYREKLIPFANPLTAILTGAFMYWFLKQNMGYIELSQNSIISPLLFYPITLIGMWFCVSVAASIQKIPLLTKLFSYFGSISFHIMALHMLVFKIFDRICGQVLHWDAQLITRFPTALDNIGLVYTILGLGISASIVFILTKAAEKFNPPSALSQ